MMSKTVLLGSDNNLKESSGCDVQGGGDGRSPRDIIITSILYLKCNGGTNQVNISQAD
jgi:hypothetical protein